MEFEAVAYQANGRVLFDVGDGLGQVVDLEDETVSRPLPVNSILARGYWEDTTGVPADLIERADTLREEITTREELNVLKAENVDPQQPPKEAE
jgi:hypothetical protein